MRRFTKAHTRSNLVAMRKKLKKQTSVAIPHRRAMAGFAFTRAIIGSSIGIKKINNTNELSLSGTSL
jgi:hypothetical protein